MDDPDKTRIIAAFTVALVGGTAVLALLLWAFERFAGIDIGSAGAGVAPLIVAAMVAGQRHAMAVQAMPRSGYAWSVAGWCMGVSCLLGTIGLAVFYAIDPVGMAAGLRAIGLLLPAWATATIMVVSLLMQLVLLRWFYAFGARTQLKAQAKAKT